MSLSFVDSVHYLHCLTNTDGDENQTSKADYDCIYIDPMYPENAKKRKSLPKKGMAAARLLAGEGQLEGDEKLIIEL